ncbi:GNAT family N-acetyltransferase [Undibacterium sp. TJN19]|uniref:GNAT family N-acetyltransferase n=1 Tax=Undibacterium sp. TJN19 TaxID=3413055 RepID=UPI003BF0D137
MQISKVPHIKFQGLELRNLNREDARQWYAYLQNPEVVLHTSWNLQFIDDLLLQFDSFESDAVNSGIKLAIIDTANQQLAGTIGFHTISTLNHSAEISYDLAPAYWGRRIAQAAAKALCEWGFNEFDLNRIQATALDSNINSCKVLERLGFEREGYLRAFRMVRGQPGNFWMYSLLHPRLASK